MRKPNYVACIALLCLPMAQLPAGEIKSREVLPNREALRVEIESLRSTGRLSICGIEIATCEALSEFYERRDFSPAWSTTEKIGELVDSIRAVYDEGLEPEDYNLAAVERVHGELSAGQVYSPAEVADSELLLTDSLIRLGYHRLFGKVSPADLDSSWNFPQEFKSDDPLETLQQAIDSPSLTEFLEAHLDRGPYYARMLAALGRYRRIAEDGGWPVLGEGPTLRPGMHDERVVLLAHRLSTTGDLSLDSLVPSETGGGVYAGALEAGVRRFQTRHGLDPDGIVGVATLQALNVPVATKIDKLRVNLERARWILDDLDSGFVLVNIAGFRAYVVKDNEIVWQAKVQVGKPFHQTPVFRDEITYLVINPTWTVPYSIATKELLPQIKSDPEFFEKRDFDLKHREGSVIEPASVDWSDVTTRNFIYTLVQRPGPSNALGRIKFMFPNEHSIYLHDTPSKYLFGRAERAFSHGCIRVQNPLELAELLLDDSAWDRQRIENTLAGLKETTVPLTTTVPVLLFYWTAESGPDGAVHFYRDVYSRDHRVLAALDSPFGAASQSVLER